MKLRGPDGIVEVPLRGSRLLPDGTVQTEAGVFPVEIAADGNAVWVSWNGHTARFERVIGGSAGADREIRAPMTGTVIDVPAQVGQAVTAGVVLVILEAMKMEYRLEAALEGVVEEVLVGTGDQVELGQVLVRLA